MLKNEKVFFITCFALGLAIISKVNVYASTPAQRIWGANRYETSVQISRVGWDSSYYAVLTNGENFPDAISAGPLAKKYDAPILLTGSEQLNDNTKEEIKRLGVKQVFIAGGTGVVSTYVEQQLNSMGIATIRLAGSNRYETSVKIAEKLDNANTIIVTTGADFSDGLSVAPIAAKEGIPIILTSNDNIDGSVKAFISEKKVSKSYILGGNEIISDNVVNQLPNAERILGQDKYERNINIINKFSDKLDFSRLYVASGENFPDALSASAIAPKTASPIILISKYPSDITKSFINTKSSLTKEIDVLGGIGAIPKTSLNQLSDIVEVQDMSDLIKPYYTSGWAEINQPIDINGKTYYKDYWLGGGNDGITTTISFNLEGKYTNIKGLIGVADKYAYGDDGVVEVYGDGKLLKMFTCEKGDIAQHFDLDVTGITKLDFKKYDPCDIVLVSPIIK